jgi:hypothetical protein
MSEQRTFPPRSDADFAERPAYDPVRQAALFDGVIGKRVGAFVIDAIIIGACSA